MNLKSFLINDTEKNDKKIFEVLNKREVFIMFLENSYDINNNFFFNKYCEQFKKSKKKDINELYNYFEKEYLEILKVEKTYIIKPFFNEEFENYEKSNQIKDSTMTLKNLSSYLKNRYGKPQELQNSHGVSIERQRILQSIVVLKDNKDPKEFYIFLKPGQDINKLLINKTKIKKKSEDLKDEILEALQEFYDGKIKKENMGEYYEEIKKLLEKKDDDTGKSGIEFFADILYKSLALKGEFTILESQNYEFLK